MFSEINLRKLCGKVVILNDHIKNVEEIRFFFEDPNATDCCSTAFDVWFVGIPQGYSFVPNIYFVIRTPG